MNVRVIAIFVLAFLLGGAGLIYHTFSKPPSILELRANPALFSMADYSDKIALHTRISTLFPRGTPAMEIERFFEKAGLSKTDETFFECTHKIDFGRISVIFDFPEKTLSGVQVDGWPDYNQYCKPELTPALKEDEKPIILPLMPLPDAD